MGGGVSASGGELGLNERAWQIADAMAKNAAALRVAVRQLSGGARVIDAGIDASGGFGAGRALAEICTGGGVSASGGGLGLHEPAWQIADAVAENAAALRGAVRQPSAGALPPAVAEGPRPP